jgi:hypothetical protein
MVVAVLQDVKVVACTVDLVEQCHSYSQCMPYTIVRAAKALYMQY